MDDLLSHLLAFFSSEAPLGENDGIVVAFSGGPDSTALLLGLGRLARQRRVRLHAAHLDHALDPASGGRAAGAAELARRLGVPLRVERRCVRRLRRAGEGIEEAARRIRYAFLEEVRQSLGARYVATAHHRDDQVETVLLRLLYGSGLTGLAGIRPHRGRIVRPLLGLGRDELAAVVAAAGLRPLADPTNHDAGAARNRVRHHLLPRLAAREPGLVRCLAAVADAARQAAARSDRRLAEHLQPAAANGGIAVPRVRFESLPESLRPQALALLHRRAGVPYPASGAARRELLRQLAAPGKVGCDCGDGWRWESRGGLLLLTRAAAAPGAGGFSYTLRVPGELPVPEIRARFRLERGPVAPWMFQGRPDRAGLALPLAPGDEVEIRTRRPGDRVQPFGRSRPRRLKEILIDHKVPRDRRDALALLCVGGRIAWVPGVTVDERFRLADHRQAWIAELAVA